MKGPQYRLVPTFFALLVIGLGTTLLVIFWRSPYTHTNLVTGYDGGYARTGQITVGSPVPLMRLGLTRKAAATTDKVALGEQLFFAEDCASCHGARGQGATFAPSIAGVNLQTLQRIVRQGPGAMPVFSEQTLNADQLADIAVYLQSVAKPTPTPSK